MGTVNRGAKAGGGTDYNAGQTIDPAENNADLNTLYTLVNGNLDSDNLAANAVGTSEIQNGAVTNDKVSASAAIEVSKLAQTAGQLDADIVDDYADDDATYNTTTDPLDSSATPSLPTNLQEEWERVRFVLARYGVGVPTKLTDGTNDAAWYDGLAIGPNLVPNGSFLDNNDTPMGATIAGAPSTQQLVTLPRTEGWGNYLNLADASGATTDGASWTLAGLRDQTLYLVTARVLNTTAEVVLTTTGATGTFGDLDLTTGASGDGHVAAATDWQTLAGLVETDSSGTDIVVSLNPDDTNYDFGIAKVGVFEVIGSRDAEGTGREDRLVRGGNIIQTATSTSATVSTVQTNTTLYVVPPGDNYQVIVQGIVAYTSGAGGTAIIQEKVGAAARTSAVSISTESTNGPVPLLYAKTALVAGTVYEYRLSASGGTLQSGNHVITVNLQRMD